MGREVRSGPVAVVPETEKSISTFFEFFGGPQEGYGFMCRHIAAIPNTHWISKYPSGHVVLPCRVTERHASLTSSSTMLGDAPSRLNCHAE